ncbi:MAG: hypothetical protein Q4B40_07355 [Clostridia bacterium]|nr:hypothetical protein [Clostridia bacterium]
MKLSANQKNCILKSIIFMLIFAVLLSCVSRIMTVNSFSEEYQLMTGIYKEEENSLDAIYIGSSVTYTFWNPVVAFKQYGICVYQYNCSSQPLTVAEDIIREARKTQPNAVYIIPVNTLGDAGLNDAVMHRLLDYMPFSLEKLKFTKWMTESQDLSFADSLEYYFPLLRYHSRWDELNPGHFSKWNNNIKNSTIYPEFLSGIKDVSESYKTTTEKGEISDFLKERLNSLLDYLDAEDVKAVFVTVPNVKDTDGADRILETVQKINTVNEIASARGYPVLDYSNSTQEINLDLKQDYYEPRHANIHGAIKFTYYFSEQLINMYGFKDKRKNPDYTDWNTAYNNYVEIISPYVLDFELKTGSRNYDLPAVAITSAADSENGYTIGWEESPNADGYAVYRKVENKWAQIATSDVCSYTDNHNFENAGRNYIVVPYTQTDTGRLYGNFSYAATLVQ